MIDTRQPNYDDTPAAATRPDFDCAPPESSEQPQVTIVTPFCNVGSVFHETALCVLRQSLALWEWVIVNDGSTQPESLRILDEYRRADARIRVIDHSVRRGLPAARNTGFRAARTPYVFQLDGDDLIEPTTIEKCAWFLESHPEFSFVKGYTVGFGAQQYLWSKGFHHNEEFLVNNLATATAMVRKETHARVGGYDEDIRGGAEDWDFWLRCANRGLWGSTIPEYLDWYRRRDSQSADWPNLDHGARQTAFRQELRQKYPALFTDPFPRQVAGQASPSRAIHDAPPIRNDLPKLRPRLLMIVPWLTLGGADKFNFDLLSQLKLQGWEVTIATTLDRENPWLPDFARLTPDIFILHHFLKHGDYPRFLRYLIESRRPDAVLVTNSEVGYHLLPYLRACCPDPAYVSYCHMEEENWKNGGYPRMAVANQTMLDLNIVSSGHLKQWMVRRGGEAERIDVCTTNVDVRARRPDPATRSAVRRGLGIPEDQTVILYAARLCPQKKPRVFGRVMQELSRRRQNVLALVAGGGEQAKDLTDLICSHQLDSSVRLLGPQPMTRVQELMAASDILFLPSEWEGISLSIYEAMATGLAVVGADVGGQRELVTPDTGILIAPGSEANEVRLYSEHLERLIRQPELRRRLGMRARARVCAAFRLEDMGRRMIELIERAQDLKKRCPRPGASAELGRACAVQAVELMQNLPPGGSLPKPPELAAVSPSDDWRCRELLIETELYQITHSGSWRMAQRLKRTPVFQAINRVRFGPGWDHQGDATESSADRLARIKESRSYRLIQTLKRTPLHGWYASWRYRHEFPYAGQRRWWHRR